MAVTVRTQLIHLCYVDLRMYQYDPDSNCLLMFSGLNGQLFPCREQMLESANDRKCNAVR